MKKTVLFKQLADEKTKPILTEEFRIQESEIERKNAKRSQSGGKFSRSNKRYAILLDNITQSFIPAQAGMII